MIQVELAAYEDISNAKESNYANATSSHLATCVTNFDSVKYFFEKAIEIADSCQLVLQTLFNNQQ